MKRIVIASFALALAFLCTNAFAQGKSGKQAAKTNAPQWEFPSKENLPRIEELPDPFLKPDGTRVASPEEWPEQREYLKAMLSHYMFGEMPPAPTNTTGELLYTRSLYGGRAIAETIKITFGPDDRPDCKVSFIAEVTRPNIEGRVPVFVWNQFTPSRYDGCPAEEEIVCNRHYAIVEYKKEQLAKDSVEAMIGPLATAYPGYSWGAIAMWSWGTSRIIDWLETTDFADMDKIISTGHSRGGKTALHAAIYDERIALCADNGSGCGGSACFRYLGSRLGEGYGRVETLGWIFDYFPYWWADEFGNFGTRQTNLNHENMMTADIAAIEKTLVRPMAADGVEEEYYLPFDLHFVKALIAPRALICTEGSADTWANNYGTQITWIAADEVFQFLGAEGRNALHYREGPHFFRAEDWLVIADFCDKIFFGKEPKAEYMVNPSISDPGAMKGTSTNFHYSWKRPDAK